ncbi:MAG TPA: hypothetical protein VF088_19320 [Pyrinomonadaceae bacterium]
MTQTEPHPRMMFDLNARRQTFGNSRSICVPSGSEEFWDWYVSLIRCGGDYELVSVDGVAPYSPPTRQCAVWFSGGVESSYTLEQVRHLNPDLLHIEDFPLFFGEDRKIGQIHFLCAAIAASLGYATTVIGVERNDLLLANNPFSHRYVERSPAFVEAWSRYQPTHKLVSVCSHLHKEEIISWLVEHGVEITGTCDTYRGGRWCGDCYKCFEAFYSAKAVGIDLGIPLTRRAFDTYHSEYRRFVESDFTDNFNNAYQHYTRLQIMYHLRFERERDCS